MSSNQALRSTLVVVVVVVVLPQWYYNNTGNLAILQACNLPVPATAPICRWFRTGFVAVASDGAVQRGSAPCGGSAALDEYGEFLGEALGREELQ